MTPSWMGEKISKILTFLMKDDSSMYNVQCTCIKKILFIINHLLDGLRLRLHIADNDSKIFYYMNPFLFIRSINQYTIRSLNQSR